MALYRKYRSATFTEVVGQEHVTGPLSAALDAHRINHAYLFSGPRGCGKTSSARILARSLNCAEGPTSTPCGVCDSCRELAPNGSGSIDVIEIDAASHGGVDDARELRERAFYAPARDRYKVYIIDEAHMVSTQGFNALLKLVEEPPDFLVFVFATTEPDKVLQTIRSRTHHYPFRLLPPTAMRKHLEHICELEGVSVEQAVFPLVVRAGGGSARDALSILDQLIAGAGSDGVGYANAVALLGVTDAGLLDDMVDALAAGDAAAVYGTVDRIVEAGHDPRRFGADLLERFRDLLILDAVPEAATNGLLDLPADALSRMTDQSARIGRASAVRYAEIVHAALSEMRGTTAPRLVLELVCARMLLPDAATDSAALLQRLERLERRHELSGGDAPGPQSVAAPQVTPSATPRPAAPQRPTPPAVAPKVADAQPSPAAETVPATDGEPAPAAPDKAASAEQPVGASAPQPTPDRAPAPTAIEAKDGTLDSADLRRLWPEVLELVKQNSRRARALLDSAQVSAVDGSQVTLSISSQPLARLLSEESNAAAVATALTTLVGGTWRITVVADGSPPPPTPDDGPEPGPLPPPRTPPPRTPPPRTPSPRTPAPSAEAEPDPRDNSSDDAAGHNPEADALALLSDTLGAKPMEPDRA
ncbi:MAG: DNA polymerase III subunit gamma and tau [Jatrophihabitans sp.]